MLRDEARWSVLLAEPETVLYLYWSPEGATEGYAVLQAARAAGPAALSVRDLVATSADAYRALVGLVLSHDLAANVRWYCSVDEPLAEVLADPAPLRSSLERGLMLRIVDVAGALARRPAYAEGRLVMRIVDQVCAWNDGVWEVTATGSRFSAEREDDEPMLTLDIRALAQLFNGYRSATQLARAGRIQAHHARAVAIADIMFAMRTPPFCADEF
jgi:predicted acetyltransferase